MSPTISVLLMLACAAVFYKAAQIDKAPRVLWPALSILFWVGASYWLGLGIVGCLLFQVGLLVAITGVRLAREKIKGRRRV